MFNQFSKRQNLTIFAINIADDVMKLYAMHRKLDIYKYCLIEEVLILLHMTSLSAIYQLIHALMTLRMAVTYTIHKILYNFYFGNSEHSSGEIAVMVLTPKNS